MRNPFLAGAVVVMATAALAACGSSAGGNGPEAAGIAGVTKAVHQLRHRTLVPSLHAEEPN
ncbi:hypothetical protein AB0F31_33800, partial [Streptomyces griseus]